MFERFTTLTRWMTTEEWRLHSTLFGGRRFAGFPLMLLTLAAVASFALAHLGISLTLVSSGVVVLAVFLGLQMGSIGFEGSDALDNLLGDITLLIYTSRTLPISGRSALAAFIVKDFGYYSGLFLLPITIGVILGAWVEALLFPSDILVMCLNCGGIETYTTWHTALVGIRTWLAASGAFLGGLALALVLSGVSIAARAVGRSRSDTRTTRNLYSGLSARLGRSKTAALAAKTVLDVHRSSGGVWKLAMSSATLLGASYVVLELVSQHVPIVPAYGVLFGALLSVTAFPTYTWVTRIDDPGDYRLYPVTGETLVRAKAWAFVALQTPVVLVYYAIVFVALAPALTDVLVGTVVLAGLLAYVFGLTVALTGFSPSEFLFDTVVFAKYSLAAMVALLPPLMVGLFLPVTGSVALGLAGYGGLCGLVGLGLFTRASGRVGSELSPTAR